MTKHVDDQNRDEGNEERIDDELSADGIRRTEDNQDTSTGEVDHIVTDDDEDVQFSPQINTDLREMLHIFGKLKYENSPSNNGPFSLFVEKSLKRHIAIYFLINPGRLSDFSDIQELDPAEFSNNINQFTIDVRTGLAKALDNLPRETKEQGRDPLVDLLDPKKDGQNPMDESRIKFLKGKRDTSITSDSSSEKKYIGAQINKGLSKTYKDMVRIANDGSFRGKFSPFAERAFKYGIVLEVLIDSNIQSKITSSEHIEDKNWVFNKIEDYADEVRYDLGSAYQAIPEEIIRRASPKPISERIFSETDQQDTSTESKDVTHNHGIVNRIINALEDDPRINIEAENESVGKIIKDYMKEGDLEEDTEENKENLIPSHLVSSKEENEITIEKSTFTGEWGEKASNAQSGNEMGPIEEALYTLCYILQYSEKDVGEYNRKELRQINKLMRDEMDKSTEIPDIKTEFGQIKDNEVTFEDLLEVREKLG